METFTPNPQDSARPLIQQASPVTDEQLQDAIRTVLRAIGEDPEREGRGTGYRDVPVPEQKPGVCGENSFVAMILLRNPR